MARSRRFYDGNKAGAKAQGHFGASIGPAKQLAEKGQLASNLIAGTKQGLKPDAYFAAFMARLNSLLKKAPHRFVLKGHGFTAC